MLEMIKLPSASKHIKCMIYKQQFRSRYTDIKGTISLLEQACDDVKVSIKLKKVLKTILKVGNQMNDGAAHVGFTVDSLLKLQHAKAFDKKTSILQYVVTLIKRNDESCLDFPSDLVRVDDASRISLDVLSSDVAALIDAQNTSANLVASIIEEGASDGSNFSFASMTKFLDMVCYKMYFYCVIYY